MKIIRACDYKNRSELENYIKSLFGLNTQFKVGYKIQGNIDELDFLGLSNSSLFWGILVELI